MRVIGLAWGLEAASNPRNVSAAMHTVKRAEPSLVTTLPARRLICQNAEMTTQGPTEHFGFPLRGTKRIQRKPALSVLHTILALLDAEILHRKSLEWVIGGPLIRLERAKLQADYCAAVLTSEEHAALHDVLDAYERVFEAVAQAQRSRQRPRPDGVAMISAEVRRDFESARGALQTLFETFAHGDVWSFGQARSTRGLRSPD